MTSSEFLEQLLQTAGGIKRYKTESQMAFKALKQSEAQLEMNYLESVIATVTYNSSI